MLSILASSACNATRDQSAQLARVAKDWCLAVRASQVIPTYPLTEDLVPGDVFLTTTAVGDEVRQFEDKGFLPLDNLLVRLASDAVFKELDGFYASHFDAQGNVFPKLVRFDHVPDAKFPSYSVEVSRTGGLSLAVPIQAIPVGFSYLGAEKATASVTIAEAHTLGVDLARLNPHVDEWLARPGVKESLRPYGSLPGDRSAKPVFVRIVTRVYTASKMNVALSDAASSGADVKAGVPPPLEVPSGDQTAKTAAERVQDAITKLNGALQLQFGGRVTIASASSRSVSLNEEFARPVVIGYLAYDRQVLPDGTLGPPVSTLAKVSGREVVSPRLTEFDSSNLITAWYTKDEATRKPVLQKWLDEHEAGVDMAAFVSQGRYDADRMQMIRDVGIH
jgi:hypothetical protein